MLSGAKAVKEPTDSDFPLIWYLRTEGQHEPWGNDQGTKAFTELDA